MPFRPISNNPPSEAERSPVDDLLSRNKAWSSKFTSTKPELAAHLAKVQTPKILWIGCSDSRVPETTICDAEPGDMFVTRNIANQFRLDDDNALSVLTFAVQSVGIEHILVVGHSSCGGVMAGISSADSPPSPETLKSSALMRHLVPLFEIARNVVAENPGLEKTELAKKVVYQSVKKQIENILSTQIIKDNWDGVPSPLSGKVMNKVTIHGLYQDVATGKLEDLDLTHVPPGAM